VAYNKDRKPDGWCNIKENRESAASNCKTKTEYSKNYPGCYKISDKNEIAGFFVKYNWLNRIAPNKKWTENNIIEEIKKFSTVDEFRSSGSGAYIAAINQGIYKKVTKDLIRKSKLKWTLDTLLEEANKYETLEDFRHNSNAAYSTASAQGILSEITKNLIRRYNFPYSKSDCEKLALPYTNRQKFAKENSGAYSAMVDNKWVNELTKHFIKPKANNYKWTIPKSIEEAKKYKTKGSFGKCSGAYECLRKNNLLDTLTHWEETHTNLSRIIYSYEFEDNSVYVGLTYDIKKRQINRDSCERDAVTKYIKKTGLTPKRNILTEYVPNMEAQELEHYYIEKYKNEGWDVLNTAKGGGLGGDTLIWNKKKCLEAAKNCNNRTDFYNTYCGAYNSAVNKGWIEECLSIIPNKSNEIYWDYNMCKEEALKYNIIKDFYQNNNSVYKKIRKNKWFELLTHLEPTLNNNGYPQGHWNKKENRIVMAKESISRTDYHDKSYQAYGISRNTIGELDEFEITFKWDIKKITSEKLRNANLGKRQSQLTKDKRSKNLKGKRAIKIIQLSLEGKIINKWTGILETQKQLKITNISSALTGRQKSAGGFIWKYAQDYEISPTQTCFS